MAQKICEYLRWLKESGDYTQQKLSDSTGIPMGTLSRYFSGMEDESASFENVRKLVMVMGGSLDELAGIQPKPIEVSPEKLTEDGFTESEIKVILRWAGSQIAHSYQAVVAGLEARLSEKDERLSHRSSLLEDEHQRVEDEHRRALEEVAVERKRAAEEIQHERKRAKTASIISYAALALFVCLFVIDFLIPTMGWIQR